MFENYVPPALFVTWQDPNARTIYPVGRLVRLVRPKPSYEFVYLRASEDAQRVGFSPFVGFPSVYEVYRSRELPPFFQNRLMTTSRTDFGAQLAELGLANGASPEAILARTNGRRATDPYEIFAEFEPTTTLGEWETRFFARSLRYLPHPEDLEQLAVGQVLRCMLDVQNPADRFAICLRTDANALVGFCPAYLVEELTPLLGAPSAVQISVERLNPAPAPLQHRLQCRLRVRPTAPFHAYRVGRYEPMVSEATQLEPWTWSASVA